MLISDYKPGDESEILSLFHTTFGKPMPQTYWKWRFIDNPENKVMIKLMWDNDILAGHYAVSPVQIHSDEQSILTALSMTTMTHPHYAGRGIFTKLAEELYRDEAKKNNLKAVWGFPNNNSHYGFIKNLAWQDLVQIPTFSAAIETIKLHNNNSVSKTTAFDDAHIRAQKQCFIACKHYCLKSTDYLTWRYLKNPSALYDIFELRINDISYYAVTKLFCTDFSKKKYDIDIVELVFPDDYESLISLINTIKTHYSIYDIGKIHTWLPINSPIHIQLEKIGFNNSSPVTYFGIRIIDNNYSELKKPEKWLYSMGDSDIY